MVDTKWRMSYIQRFLVLIEPKVGLKAQNAVIKGILHRAMVDIVVV